MSAKSFVTPSERFSLCVSPVRVQGGPWCFSVRRRAVGYHLSKNGSKPIRSSLGGTTRPTRRMGCGDGNDLGCATSMHLELHYFATDHFPFERGVALDHFWRWFVRDAAKDVSAGSVRTRQTDEGLTVMPRAA